MKDTFLLVIGSVTGALAIGCLNVLIKGDAGTRVTAGVLSTALAVVSTWALVLYFSGKD